VQRTIYRPEQMPDLTPFQGRPVICTYACVIAMHPLVAHGSLPPRISFLPLQPPAPTAAVKLLNCATFDHDRFRQHPLLEDNSQLSTEAKT